MELQHGPTFIGITADGGWTCSEYNEGVQQVYCTIPSLPVGPAPSIAMTVQMPFESGMHGSGVGVFGDLTEGEVTPALFQVLSKSDLWVELAGATTAATSGGTAGGTTVTIIGDGFTPQSVASFDGVRVPTVYLSDTNLVATTRAHAPGTVHVAVVNPDDTRATVMKAFTFEPPGRGRRRSARQ
jgi:hypothetical protein